MKKSVLPLLFLFFLALKMSAQPVIEWQKAYGGSYDESVNDIKRTEDSGYIVLGTVKSFDGDVITSKTNLTPDIWVLKLDKAGQIQWSRTYGGSSDEQGVSIEITDRGYVFAGWTASADGDISYNHGGLCDIWVVSIDNSGNIVWEKTYGGTGGDAFSNGGMFRQNTDSSYILIGTTNSADGDVSSNHGLSDVWIVKLSKTGSIVWEKTIGGSSGEGGMCIEQTADGGYIAGAISFSNDGDVPNNKGHSDLWLFKLNSSGAISWKKNYGGSDGDVPSMVHQTRDGGYIVSGRTYSNDGDVSGFHPSSSAVPGADMWVIKTTANGTISWTKTLGGTGSEINYDIKELGDGYLVAGYATSKDGDVTGVHSANRSDAWLCKLDMGGSLVWQKTYGTSMGADANRLLMENDSSFLFAGSVGAADYDATGCNFHGFSDIWLVKLGSPLSVHDIDKSQSISVYPTITSGAVNIELPQAYEALSFAVTDITGRKASASISGNGAKRILTFDANTAAGLYILQVRTAHGSYSYKLVYEP
jgi:hypothetical protein